MSTRDAPAFSFCVFREAENWRLWFLSAWQRGAAEVFPAV